MMSNTATRAIWLLFTSVGKWGKRGGGGEKGNFSVVLEMRGKEGGEGGKEEKKERRGRRRSEE